MNSLRQSGSTPHTGAQSLFETPIASIARLPADTKWLVDGDLGEASKSGVAKLRAGDRALVVVAPDTNFDGNARIASAARTGLPIEKVDRNEMGRLLEQIDQHAMCDDAGHGLFRRDPLNAAFFGIRPWQIAALGAAIALVAVFFFLDLGMAARASLAAMICIMAALVAFRLIVMLAGVYWQVHRTDDADVAELDDETLPSYSILVPMLRERESTLRGLAASLQRIDYPTDRLQILFILEDTDMATRSVVDDLDLPGWFQVILIPDAAPHTKGKACNYAMNFVTGDLFTIYDAEDHPDPLQLKKAVAAFRRGGDGVVCAQSRLNFYNVKENWLTSMFTLDYSAWYFFMLPGMDALRFPICLGGTSNHFRTRVIRDLDAWDAYNVTEDADLGLRIAKSGMRTVLIDSITYEEATNRIPSWIRQRTRWIKGYILTYLIHMRRPLELFRRLGPWGFLGMQFFVAGGFIGNLIIPPLVLTSIFWATNEVWDWAQVDIFPTGYEDLAWFTLVAGNLAAIGFPMVAGIRRGVPSLALWALTLPFYWALGVIASYRAVWQVIFSPYKWEKTEHGVTKVDSGAVLSGMRATT